MNKKYISPSLNIVHLATRDGILDITSAGIDKNSQTDEQLVKGDNASRSDHNVWDDDWSN